MDSDPWSALIPPVCCKLGGATANYWSARATGWPPTSLLATSGGAVKNSVSSMTAGLLCCPYLLTGFGAGR